MLLGELVLAHAGLTVKERNPVTPGEGMNPPAEAARHPQQVLLIQGLVGPGQLAPPVAKPAAGLPERVIAGEHDPIWAVVSPLQQLLIVVGKVIVEFHAGSVRAPSRSSKVLRGRRPRASGASDVLIGGASFRVPAGGVSIASRIETGGSPQASLFSQAQSWEKRRFFWR
jgi:hypothetical protein